MHPVWQGNDLSWKITIWLCLFSSLCIHMHDSMGTYCVVLIQGKFFLIFRNIYYLQVIWPEIVSLFLPHTVNKFYRSCISVFCKETNRVLPSLYLSQNFTNCLVYKHGVLNFIHFFLVGTVKDLLHRLGVLQSLQATFFLVLLLVFLSEIFFFLLKLSILLVWYLINCLTLLKWEGVFVELSVCVKFVKLFIKCCVSRWYGQNKRILVLAYVLLFLLSLLYQVFVLLIYQDTSMFSVLNPIFYIKFNIMIWSNQPYNFKSKSQNDNSFNLNFIKLI